MRFAVIFRGKGDPEIQADRGVVLSDRTYSFLLLSRPSTVQLQGQFTAPRTASTAAMQLPLLPSSLTTKKPPPQWDPFTPLVQTLSKSACIHPIHTIVIIALLASTTYISILENSLFDRSAMKWAFGSSKKDVSLMEGSARVAVGAGTEWKWKEIGTEEFESQVRFLSPHSINIKFLQTNSDLFIYRPRHN